MQQNIRHLFIAGGGNVQKTAGDLSQSFYSKLAFLATEEISKHATRFLDDVIQFTIE